MGSGHTVGGQIESILELALLLVGSDGPLQRFNRHVVDLVWVRDVLEVRRLLLLALARPLSELFEARVALSALHMHGGRAVRLRDRRLPNCLFLLSVLARFDFHADERDGEVGGARLKHGLQRDGSS